VDSSLDRPAAGVDMPVIIMVAIAGAWRFVRALP
jgi:hypothetical protein